jgi:protein ImuB
MITAASPLAKRNGVCIGMPLSEAKSLLRRGSGQHNFHVLEQNLNQDVAAIESLCQSLENFSPIVGLETIDPLDFKLGKRPGALLLDVTGLGHLFGDETELARSLVKHLRNAGFHIFTAIADTVGAAWAAAHYLAAPFFKEHHQPLVVAPGESMALDSLPVEALRIDETVVDTLDQLGIRRVEQLLRLSRNDLAMRFGNAIHRRIDQFTGTLAEPVIAQRPPADFNAQQLLEYPTRHRETIEVVIERLVAGLCREMRSQQQGALQWNILLSCNTGPIDFTVSLFQPTATVEQIMPLVQMQLESVFQRSQRFNQPTNSTSSAPVKKKRRKLVRFEVNEIQVAVTSHVVMAQQQRNLFDENPRLDKQALSHLVNRLAGRLGTENVVYPTMQSGAQPEYSYRLKPLVDARRKTKRLTPKLKPNSHKFSRPVRLLKPPLMIEAKLKTISADPDQSSRQLHRPPAVLTIGKTDYRVLDAWGPERIETGWWRGPTVCRDYWRITVHTGQQFWVYRDLRGNRWWLHGEF